MAPKRRVGAQLQRMLLEPIPQTPVPEPYFNIPSPDPYRFPLSQTLLEGIKLLENYFPEDINQKIRKKLTCRIQRMSRYRDTYCMLGKDGNGLLIGDNLINNRGISAFAYGPNYLIIAYEDLRIQVYDLNLQLIKQMKNFTTRKIKFIKILNTPKTFQGIIILCNIGQKVSVFRIQKSFFSKLSCKLSVDVLTDLQFPVTQMTQIPLIFKAYLRKDPAYKDCSLVCVSAINKIYIIRVNHFKLNMQKFWDVVYRRVYIGQPTTNSVSWGQGFLNTNSFDIKGDKLILTYSFGSLLYFLAFKQVDKYLDGQVITKCDWFESKSFNLKQSRVAFCQYMKKNQILIVTEDNTVAIFHTKNFEIFQKQINIDQIQVLFEKFSQHLEGRIVQTIPGTRPPHLVGQTLTPQQQQMIGQIPLVTFADSFSYEYPSSQIFYLTEQNFGVYVYCNWKLITNILKVEQRYQSAMLFLIAMAKKANKFDLELQGSEKQLSQAVQMLATQYINNKITIIKKMPEILKQLTTNEQYFKIIITPIELLTETQQFTFLFEVAKDKIISALSQLQSQQDYKQAEKIFYEALNKFIENGRIKYIPESKLQSTLDYYVNSNRLDIIDRLAIYFDLEKIDTNIVIQCLLKQNLVVSLAYICTQGNQNEFITPFVKFWSSSQTHRLQKNIEYAKVFAFRALWYVKLCLQRNWALKEYSFDKYSKMITVLSQHFLSESILTSLLKIRSQDCLDTLSYYFTRENATIINQIKLNLKEIKILDWIQPIQNNYQLQKLLSSIEKLTEFAQGQSWEISFNQFLSGIIVYKTLRFKEQKYYQILIKLIKHYRSIKQVKYGLEKDKLDEYMEVNSQYSKDQLDSVLAARYIIRIFTLAYYQAKDYIHGKLDDLYQLARQNNLTDLQAQIAFTMGKFQNSIDIYARAQPFAKILVFEFLQNAFKKLVLMKKKQQKIKLAKNITKQIKWMVRLNATKTKNIVDIYIPQIQQDLIDALKDDEILQLQYLQDILNDEGYNKRAKKLSDKTITKFVQLMAKLKPDELIDVFKKIPYLSIQESLKICQQYEVYQCMEYLYERMGSIEQSVKIAAKRIDQILKNKADFDEYEAPYIKIKQILDNAIEVCKRNKSQQVWQALLDSSIQLHEKYQHSDLPEDEVQIFYYINGEIMEHLASNIPLEHTIDLLQNKYQNLNMGGKMTKAFVNILSNLSHSINILYIVQDLVKNTLQNFLDQDYLSKLHCYRTSNFCETCEYGLLKRQKTIHFKCGHAFHKQCVLKSEQQMVCVMCLLDKSDQFTYYLNTLNPMHPKIQKLNVLFQQYSNKKLEMNQIFKVQQFEQTQKKQEHVLNNRILNKKDKFLKFDESINDIEIGNRRVQKQLKY